MPLFFPQWSDRSRKGAAATTTTSTLTRSPSPVVHSHRIRSGNGNGNGSSNNGHAHHILCSRAAVKSNFKPKFKATAITGKKASSASASTSTAPPGPARLGLLEFDSMYAIPPPNYRRDPTRSAEKLL